MRVETLAKIEGKLRSLLVQRDPATVIEQYSRWRKQALRMMSEQEIRHQYEPPHHLERIMWGIRFRAPLMNGAGMYKNFECYERCHAEGAGAYIGGTSVADVWPGNIKGATLPNGKINEIADTPFVPYPRSRMASNTLGLPSDGDEINQKRATNVEVYDGCPMGASLMISPKPQDPQQKLTRLAANMLDFVYADVDFIEQNESCPNTAHGSDEAKAFTGRAAYVYTNVIQRLPHFVPFIVKWTNDAKRSDVPFIMDIIMGNGYSGVNFGNTIIDYAEARKSIHPSELTLFDFYVATLGGGVSGAALKEKSLELTSAAVDYVKKGGPGREFRVWRTGGIDCPADLALSERAGISMNQWFTGRFAAFAEHGERSYEHMFRGLRLGH